jgi:hypothetical protein
MVLGDPTGKSPTDQIGPDRGPGADVQAVNDICLEPDDFTTTQRLMDKSVPSLAPDSGFDSDESSAPPQVSAVAKLFLILLAALTVAIIVPWLFPFGFSGSQQFSSSGDRGRFNAPAGSGDRVSGERSSTPGYVAGSIGSLEDLRPAEQNCLGPGSALQPRELGLSPQGPPAIQSPRAMEPFESILRRLQKIEHQLHECELILQLLDSGKGVFSGFVPENNDTGISSLARFQERIVQLEMNKRALAVRFTPSSKEIHAIDVEIQGIKSAMRECVAANIRFFQKGRDSLLAEKAKLEQKRGPTGANGKMGEPQCSEPSLLGKCWSFVTEGIDAVINQLAATGKSVAMRVVGFGNKIAAYVTDRSDRTAGAGSQRANDWSRLAGSGRSKHSEARISHARTEKAQDSYRAKRNTHRAVGSVSSAQPAPESHDPTGARRRLKQSLRDTNSNGGRQ